MLHHFSPYVLRFVVDVARLALWLALLVAIFVPLEHLFALRPAKFWRKQSGIDLVWYFVNSLLPAALLSLPLALLSRTLRGWDPAGLYSEVALWSPWVKFPLMLIVNDLGAYWGHRALHAHSLLWRFHALHHSAESMDWLVNTRAHPFDMVFTRFCGLTPVYVLGLAQAHGSQIDPGVALLTIFATVWTFFIHANIQIRLGPLEWIISSPAFHHWHHTNDEHRDHNFAFVFPFLDRLFGTAWLPKYWPPGYGIDERVPSTVAGQFFDLIESGDRSADHRTGKPNDLSPDRNDSSIRSP